MLSSIDIFVKIFFTTGSTTSEGVSRTTWRSGFVSTKFWDEFGENNSKFEYDNEISLEANHISDLISDVIETKNNYVVNEVTCRSYKQVR